MPGSAFSPHTELPFAGHPILGTAFALASQTDLNEVGLQTGQGVIRVSIERADRRPVFGWMEQPIPTVAPFARTPDLLALLDVPRSELPVEVYDNGVQHLFVMLGTEAAVRQLRPDAKQLIKLLPENGANCLAPAGSRWKTRFFGPGLGVYEDAATGSAAGPLAVHLRAMAGFPLAGRLRYRRARSSDVRRPSTPALREVGIGSRPLR